MSAQRKTTKTEWIRSEIDPIRTGEALIAGERFLLSDGYEPTMQDIIFVLLQEAYQTECAEKGVGPRGDVSCMPEVYHTNAEIFATEIDALKILLTDRLLLTG